MNHQHALEVVPLSSLEFVKFEAPGRQTARKIGKVPSSRKTPNSKAQSQPEAANTNRNRVYSRLH